VVAVLQMVPALEAFVGRWLRAAAAAAAAAAKPAAAPLTRAAAALSAMREVWAVLRTKLDAGGPPGAFESSLLTAATLCSLAPTVRETLTCIVAGPSTPEPPLSLGIASP
jgi:hypothetical protein